MGGCIGITRARNASVDDTSGNSTRTSSGNSRKNHPLCHEVIRWKSDVPLTEGQLRSKRDEFWDTAPAFDGRKEIWDALRAGATAAEAQDYQLAQAILDGANVSVPNGFLTECYDELGTRYQVPIYCLSYPINIVKEDSGRDSPADCSDGGTEQTLKLRLSTTLGDVKLPVYSKDTIGIAKKKLQSQEGLEPSRQRWFFGGKLLGDKMHIEEAKVQPGYVIQVIVNPEKTDDSPAKTS
ncbi:PREDICTED: ubiquitin domain-containing protein 1 isoform X2 [Polistes canadensis]|uniref:ubiquitin domain-containing protein 1 isoform X2 n=1 Tax=Polistes canadensis TaxID=91411 RepID=UPI000718F87E|nr:PREDICTED: ubiquitin domain-containing protein 1 isoform X2 [Polistes canadensis]